MADPKKEPEKPPEPPPAPPAPPPPPTAAADAAKKEVKDVKPHFSITRPLRYIKGFLGGTFDHTFDGMADWGRKGSWLGLGVAAVLGMSGAIVSMPFLAVLVVGWVGGLAAGAAAGGLVGLVTGGMRGVGVEYRKVKYKEDLVQREDAKTHGHTPHNDYRADLKDYNENHVKNNYFVDRVFQQDHELRQQEREESRGFFQEMVHQSRQHDHDQGLA